jgi:hypothetical protein
MKKILVSDKDLTKETGTANLLTAKEWWLCPLLFILIILSLHGLARFVRMQINFDMDNYWPVSIFLPKLPAWQDGVTLLGLVVIWIVYLKQAVKKSVGLKIFLLAFMLLLGTNLLGGVDDGLVGPIAGHNNQGIQYWFDVERMTTIPNLVTNYVSQQPTLLDHSRVHPPGPMLFIFLATKIWHQPIFVSLSIALLSLLSAVLLWKILSQHVSSSTAAYITALFLVVPAFQIYALASIDALICTLFLATFWAWQKANQPKWFLLTLLLLWLAFFFNFGAVFLMAVLFFDNWRENGSIRKSIHLLIGLCLSYVLFGLLTGYNYWDSFVLAKSYEGSNGFYLLESPLSYLATRIEDVLEILVFLGPFLVFLLYKSCSFLKPWQNLKKFPTTGFAAIVAILGFFAAGGYYTGETARAAMYIYPFLLIPIAFYLEKIKPNQKAKLFLLSVVFGQAVLMQAFGWYAW